MQLSNFSAGIGMCKISQTFLCGNTPMLTLSIHYPKIALCEHPAAQGNINCHIQAQVDHYYRHASNDLYTQAIADYQEAQKNGYPFHAFDAVLQYEVSYNRDCYLSLYRDQYEFTGGAHGNTIRASDSWNLANGRTMALSCFFLPGQAYRAFLIEQILQQADEQMQQNPGIFFEDYRKLIPKYFNENSYYLTPSGLAIYYQQYEIAPYATGIVVFTIPYDALNWQPSCRGACR